MNEPVFPRERNTPSFTSGSSEFRAELLRFLRVPATVTLYIILVIQLLGIPAFSWKFDQRNNRVIRSYAITITGQRHEYSGAVPLLFFVARDGSILYPVIRTW